MTKEDKARLIQTLSDIETCQSWESKAISEAIQALEEEHCPYWDYGLKTCRHANVGALATINPNDVLEKIRAEIEEIEKNYRLDKATKYGNKNEEQQNLSYSTMMMYEVADITDEIKDIIDKYKAESEE